MTQPLVSPPPSAYFFYHKPRQSERVGGVDFLVSNKFKVKSHYVQIYYSFEAVCIEVSNCSITGYFLCLYRPPGITSSFFVDVGDLIENLVTIHPAFFILGDFSLHLDTQSTATSTRFSQQTFMVTGLLSS